MDLASIDLQGDAEKGAELELVHPVSKAPLGIFIECIGRESRAFHNAAQDMREDARRRAANDRERGKTPQLMTEDQEFKRGSELLSIAVKGWRTGDEKTITLKGEKLTCNIQNIQKVFKDFRWIYEQVNLFVGDLANFTTG